MSFLGPFWFGKSPFTEENVKEFVLVAAALFSVSLAFAQGPEKRIVVSLEAQKVFAYDGEKLVMELKCSTGRPSLETPTGEFKIAEKKRHNYALPKLGGAYIPYTIRVPMYDPKQGRVRRIAFHEYRDVPDKPASNGCIRLKKGDAEKLYNWAVVGTKVVVVQNKPPLP